MNIAEIAFAAGMEKAAAIVIRARPGKNGGKPTVSVHASPDRPRTIRRRAARVTPTHTPGMTYHSDASDAVHAANRRAPTVERKITKRVGRKAGRMLVDGKKPPRVPMSRKTKAGLGLGAALLTAGALHSLYESSKPEHERLGNK